MTGLDDAVLIGIGILVAGVIAARFADRVGAPALLLFLGLGMLLGEDGPGGIAFDNAHLTEQVGLIALTVILFEGGLSADRTALRRVILPATTLATLGVVITASVVGLAAHEFLDLPWRHALLLGAVVSATDAAAVFSALRGVSLSRRLVATLEGESGLNDPVAALLVILLVELITTDGYGADDIALLLVQQLVIGAVGGWLFARVASRLLRNANFASSGLFPVAALASALACFAAVTSLGGSGLLAVYLLGLLLARARPPYAVEIESFHAGAAWIAQISLFVLLGLLVSPNRLVDEGTDPLLIALVLIAVARPLAVAICVTPFGYRMREQAFLAWAGLRGGVPIVFATIPIVEGVATSRRIFDIVFYVVVVSVFVQGLGLRRVADWLGVREVRPSRRLRDFDVATLRSLGAELVVMRARELGVAGGIHLRELRLPAGAIVAVIRRADGVVTPRGSTVLEPDDVLHLLVEHPRLRELEVALDAIAIEPRTSPDDAAAV